MIANAMPPYSMYVDQSTDPLDDDPVPNILPNILLKSFVMPLNAFPKPLVTLLNPDDMSSPSPLKNESNPICYILNDQKIAPNKSNINTNNNNPTIPPIINRTYAVYV